MTKKLSEIRIPFCSDFGIVWILVVLYSDIHCSICFPGMNKLVSLNPINLLYQEINELSGFDMTDLFFNYRCRWTRHGQSGRQRYRSGWHGRTTSWSSGKLFVHIHNLVEPARCYHFFQFQQTVSLSLNDQFRRRFLYE